MGDARAEARGVTSAEEMGCPVSRQTVWRVREVERVFAERYSIGLAGLERLFNDACWSGTRFGGPKWAEICQRVTALARALEGSDEAAISDAHSCVLDAEHNSSNGPGGVRRKLECLRSRCG